MKNLGIYIHIPFCKKKCEYCDFKSFSDKNEYVEKYIQAICEDLRKSSDKAKKYSINTIYFGGGTPSYIEGKYIKQILVEIKNNYNVLNDSEITIEINPGTVSKDKLELYKEIGINRLSIGLQTTENRLLKLIGRIHNYEEFLNTYNLARDVGFQNINIDLMLGLPTQTMEELEKSANDILNLNPEHISIYSLILEEGTQLYRKVESGELTALDEELERKMYWKTKNMLEKAGFKHYEISNFSKQNLESKHNLNCWNQEEYLGFGIAAHSYFENKRFSKPENIEDYIKDITSVFIEETQDREKMAKEYMLLGLRKIAGVSISEFERKFELNPLFYFRFEISKLEEEDLIEVDLDNIKLTEKGLDLANLVFEEFV